MAKPRGDALPCGSDLAYARCCEPCHLGQAAATAEALMRSRYSAYVLALHDYLRETWHADTRPADVRRRAGALAGARSEAARAAGRTHAIVEFVARYRADGRGHRLHRDQPLRARGGRWYYVDGDFDAD